MLVMGYDSDSTAAALGYLVGWEGINYGIMRPRPLLQEAPAFSAYFFN